MRIGSPKIGPRCWPYGADTGPAPEGGCHHQWRYIEYALGVIEAIHRGLTPLIVPLTLIRHYVKLFDVRHMGDQVYLNPHPKELMLRNHV